MEKTHRNRRSIIDLKQLLLPYKNVLLGWEYAGDKETMRELFPDEKVYWDAVAEQMQDDYFSQIPTQSFRDQEIILRYGENLQKQRKAKGWALKDVSSCINISIQQLEQIEKGQRKFINKNLLLLFCGFYHVSPKILMGFQDPLRDPMVFYPEITSKKARYVVERLVFHRPELLEVFCYFSIQSIALRKALFAFLSSAPVVKQLTTKQIEQILNSMDSPAYNAMVQNKRKEGQVEPRWGEYCGYLCEMGDITPELLDIYLSIAMAGETVWDNVMLLMSLSGFLLFPPERNDRTSLSSE